MTSVAVARCTHFGSCGGCSIQDLSYAEQLSRKQAALQALYAPYWKQPIPVHASPTEFYYRNKMEFGFGRLGRREPPEGKPYEYILEGTVLGLKRKGRWDQVLDLSECFLLSPEAPALLESVRKWCAAEGLDGYDMKSSRGFLRYLLVREGKGTGQRLVMAITAPGAFPGDSFVAAVRAAYPATTVLRGIAASVSDVAQCSQVDTLYGPGYIEEEIDVGRKLRFKISPFSFFQTNSKGTELLYRLIRDFSSLPSGKGGRHPAEERGVRESRAPLLYDLYGGAGGIAFTLSDLFEKVISVENNASASEDGRYNARLNGIENVEFVTAAVEDYLKDAYSPGRASAPRPPSPGREVVVLDPARAGMHLKALKTILNILPTTIVYVSCNPKLLAADLAKLTQFYKVTRLEAVDMFPQTEHVEAVALLELI